MYLVTGTVCPSSTTYLASSDSSIRNDLHSFSILAQDAFNITILKIKEVLPSLVIQGICGFVLGLGAPIIYSPLTEKIVKTFGISSSLPDPLKDFIIDFKAFDMLYICGIVPIIEEKIFRGTIQEALKSKLNCFYLDRDFSESTAKTASRVTSVFFTSIIFGLSHFANAIVFWCNPVLFVPQVVATTIMGIMFGVAKEISGDLHMSIGMHIGNNVLACASLYNQV